MRKMYTYYFHQNKKKAKKVKKLEKGIYNEENV